MLSSMRVPFVSRRFVSRIRCCDLENRGRRCFMPRTIIVVTYCLFDQVEKWSIGDDASVMEVPINSLLFFSSIERPASCGLIMRPHEAVKWDRLISGGVMMEDCRIRRSEFIGVPPVYTGVVFLLSWIYLLFYAQTAGIEAAAPVSLMSGPYLVSALVMSLTLLAISFAPFGRVEFLTASFAKIAAPFRWWWEPWCLWRIPPSYLAVVFIWVGGILTGVGSGVMAQQWIVAYRRVGLGVALGSFPTLMAMSVGVCVTLMYLPGNALRVATVVSPVVSGVLFHLVGWSHGLAMS